MNEDKSQSVATSAAIQAATTAAIASEKAAVQAAVTGTKIDSIEKSIIKIEVSVKEIAQGYVTHAELREHIKVDEDHENRIRELKAFQDTLSGKMWGIGMAAGALSSIIGIFISHFWK